MTQPNIVCQKVVQTHAYVHERGEKQQCQSSYIVNKTLVILKPSSITTLCEDRIGVFADHSWTSTELNCYIVNKPWRIELNSYVVNKPK